MMARLAPPEREDANHRPTCSCTGDLTAIVEPMDRLPHKYLRMTTSICNLKATTQQVPIELHNHSDEFLEVGKDQQIGSLEQHNQSDGLVNDDPEQAPELKLKTPDPSQDDSEDMLSWKNNGSAYSEYIEVGKKKEEQGVHSIDFDKADVSPEERKRLKDLLLYYGDIFATNVKQPGQTGAVQHHIDTQQTHPIRTAPYRRSPQEQETIKTEIDTMLRDGIVQRSTSPWASPVVLVTKKDGSVRFCVDFRKLNEATVKDTYPLPRIDDTLDALHGARYFTTLDLAAGYWQIRMEDESRAKTAFVSKYGLYEFNVLPFGLCNAPATFQRLMDTSTRGTDVEGMSRVSR